jgi:capsular polysaccharide biosynthesis protein
MPQASDSMIALSKLNQNGEQPWPFFWTHHRNVRLIGPGLALLNENNQICVEATYGQRRLRSDPAWQFGGLRPAVRLQGSWTSVVSRWNPVNERTNFSHWFFDAIPRLAALPDFSNEVRIIVPPGLQAFQRESLEMLGLQGRFRPTAEKHVAIEDFYFISPPTMVACYNPYSVVFQRSKFLQHADLSYEPPDRIYINRHKQFRTVANEEEVTEFFRSRGFAVIDTAALTLGQQIRLFSQADVICGVHGAAFANTMWCKQGCKVFEFFSQGFLNGCYEWVCYCVKAEHHFLVFPCDAFLNAHIDLPAVQSMLCASGVL